MYPIKSSSFHPLEFFKYQYTLMGSFYLITVVVYINAKTVPHWLVRAPLGQLLCPLAMSLSVLGMSLLSGTRCPSSMYFPALALISPIFQGILILFR